MASGIVSSAAKQLGKILVEEAKYLYAVKDNVEALHEELTWMHTFLQDADTKEHQDGVIRMWVSQIRDFAYEAEDIVESYLHKVSRHRQEGICNTLKWFSCVCCDCWALHGVGSDIDRLKQKISGLSSRMRIYGVENKSTENLSHKKRVMELRRTTSYIAAEEPDVGESLDEGKQLLVEKFANPEHKVVCITGMGGLGKTTLAKMVYRDLKDKGVFEKQVWVYVSQQFQARNIFESILLKFLPVADMEKRRNIKDLREEEVPSEVRKVLKEHKCLVVLDDIWNEQAWGTLVPAFNTLWQEESQSKLLLTTRNGGLLSHVDRKGFHYEPKLLNVDESWDLLKKVAFRGTAASDVEKFKPMAKHCNGLPLALVILGGILATKSSTDEWEKVQQNIDSFLKNGTSKNENLSILQILELSYDDLPYYLKPCFLHLGNFPEDYQIPTKRLYHMWAIEGLVAEPYSTSAGEWSAEAFAEKYLEELANRCLVQLDRKGKKGKIKSCRLHDLVRDMCLKKSRDENFLEVIEHGDLEKLSSNGDLEKGSSSNSSSLRNQRFRRLVVHLHKKSDSLKDFIPEQNKHHVRSLLFFQAGEVPRKLSWPPGKVSEPLKLVRVLHFEDVCIRSLPKEIGDLIHLRYLSLKGTRVRRLPSSVGKLRYLQILDLRVRESINVIIPNVIRKLERLKHLYLPNNWETVFSPGVNDLVVDIADAIATSPAPLRSVRLRLRLRDLIQLETLENLRLDQCLVEDLLRLEKLRKVSLADYTVTGLQSLTSFLKCAGTAAGQFKMRPLSLTLHGAVLSKDPSVLVSSKSQLQLHKLNISGKMWLRLRYARIFPQDLKQLTLNRCELEDDPMPILEKLPHLAELTLGEKTFTGTEMVCTATYFPKLAILRLVRLENLGKWQVENGAMPGLKTLYIYSCEKLAMIPSELPEGVKIGCRPCIYRDEQKHGKCDYITQQAPGS